jgi:hypothetical protein
MKIGEIAWIHVLRRVYWLLLIASFLLALPFALHLFLVGPPLAIIVLVLGAITARFRASMQLFQLIVLAPSFVSALCMALVLWGENLALGGPFMIWVLDAFLIVTFKIGQIYGHRREVRRGRTDRSAQPI